MTTSKILLSPPHLGPNEKFYVKEAFNANWIAPMGENVREFEAALKEHLNDTVEVVAVNSGTSAIHLGLSLLNVGQGDEVICQSFTFVASVNPVLYLGASPVFVDSETETWNMCPKLLEQAIEDRLQKGRKPKAILIVDLYGMPFKYKEIRAVADTYGIPILEDSAEALGSNYFGEKCGLLGDIGVYSFNGNKIITTSAGGALLTKGPELKHKATFLANQAKDNRPHYEHSTLGYNYAMSNVLAGIGRGQMEVLPDRVEARRNNFNYYLEKLSEIEEIEFLEEPYGYYSNRWLSCILLPNYDRREALRGYLSDFGIETRPLMKPLHTQPLFQKYPSFDQGISEDLFTRGLSLPSGSSLDMEDLKRISSTVLDFFRK